LLQFHRLRTHFNSYLETDDDNEKAMATAAIKVLDYQRETSHSDFHVLGLLLDPLEKDSMFQIPELNGGEVRLNFK
jgi:hypothetical protein